MKNIFAFILEKLGFEQVAEAMKEFSFKEMILNVFGGIADFFKSIFCSKPCIDDESIFSTKKTRGLVAFIKILSINETSVLPPRLEPPVPKNNTFSNF